MQQPTPRPAATSTTIIATDIDLFDRATMTAAGFLAGYRGETRTAYAYDLKVYGAWCADHGLDPLAATRTHIEMYARAMEGRGLAAGTISRRLSTLVMWYRWCYQEDVIAKDPGVNVRRPRVPRESSTKGLDRMQMGAMLTHAEMAGPRDHALVALLILNGLRVSEACGANIEDLGSDRGHQTLKIMGKGDKPATIPLAPRAFRAVMLATGERVEGPILLGYDGQRLRRDAAGRITRRIGRRAGIPHSVHPHVARHAFVTAALDAGVPLRDVQNSARHADPRTTLRYDRGRAQLDKHATYVVQAFVAGGG